MSAAAGPVILMPVRPQPPFRSLGTVIADVFAANPYAGWQQALDPLYPRGVHNYWRSALLRTTDDASLHVLMDSFAARPTGLTEIHLQHLDGAVGRVPADATAFALRDQEFMVNVCARTETAEGFADAVEWCARRNVRSRSGRSDLRKLPPVRRIPLALGRRNRQTPIDGSSN
jgi:hypothetical protein